MLMATTMLAISTAAVAAINGAGEGHCVFDVVTLEMQLGDI